MSQEKSDLRDGMRIDWDVPIKMDDGIVLRADVYRPPIDGRYPIIMSYGPYAKGLAFQEGYPDQWNMMIREHPDVVQGSSTKYVSWETADPERWVPDGYVIVRVDSRGCGRSPGFVDPYSPRERKDYYECIEWAAKQPWSAGKVGLLGISYFAITQWQVAALRPPHLVAIIPWEGAVDFYRDMARHGGILCTFRKNWFPKQVMNVQHGLGTRGRKNPNNGEPIAGPETLSEEELMKNRTDPGEDLLKHYLEDEYYLGRTADLSKITIPLLSCANWGGNGLHARGNFEGFMRAASKEKWLEVHGLEHWTLFYTSYGLAIQKRFFARYLKGEENGWEKTQPRVLLNVRTINDGFVLRGEDEWPIARTKWTRFYLNKDKLVEASVSVTGKVEYDPLNNGVTFSTTPFERETELTGPSSAKLFVSSTTSDADLFVVLRLFAPNGREAVFRGALDPHNPLAQGWLRASQRKLDRNLTLPYRPYHVHDDSEPMTPYEVYELDIEIWPTSIIVPKDYRIALTVQGRDYEYGGEGTRISTFTNQLKGSGPFLHNDPRDRPPELFGGKVTIYYGENHPSSILLPIVPPKRS
jgi:predicted acyl esterase